MAVASGVALAGFAVVAVALDGPSPATCTGDITAGVTGTPDELKAQAEIVTPSKASAAEPSSRVWALPRPAAAGTYVVGAVSWDGYLDRSKGEVQPFEIWYLELLDADGNRIARTSRTTADLPDGADEATWVGSLGQLTWTGAAATQARVVHPEASPTVNSVVPVCISLTIVVPPTTAPVPTASSPTVPAAPSPTVSGDTADRSPTTTVAVEVKGIAITNTPSAQVADANQVQPRFTG